MNYEFIKSLKNVANLTSPEDRRWEEIFLDVDRKAFEKYYCPCLKKKNKNEKDLEIILKPYAYSIDKEIFTYYIGQCPRCEIIYYVRN